MNNISQIKIAEDKKEELNSYVMFLIQAKNRDKLQKFLTKKGIQSLVYYSKPLHKHTASKKFKFKSGTLPVAERLANEVLALPHHQNLTKKQILYVCQNIKQFYK